uniref:CCHC-type domain-containing protein n=1 Tax=Branchiostoma floridae TaxID=7739 RepID=C3ZPP5_BRAFL|eukprot:XP_002589455.1 hypothetical protein BRAFLDRAFT_80149 [Branchiostoma floridae]
MASQKPSIPAGKEVPVPRRGAGGQRQPRQEDGQRPQVVVVQQQPPPPPPPPPQVQPDISQEVPQDQAGQDARQEPPGAQVQDPQQGQQQQGEQAVAGGQAQTDIAALVTELNALKQQVGAMRGGRSSDDIKEELVQYAGRPGAAFDPHRALALVETLVMQARREGHKKAHEYSIILDQIYPLAREDFFRQLIVNQFGSTLEKQVNKEIAQFVKNQGKIMPRESRSMKAVKYDSLKRRERHGLAQARPDDKCYRCHGLGHFARDCTKSRNGKNS